MAAVTLVAVGSWAVREQAGDVLTRFYNEATKSKPAPVAPTYSVEPQETVDAVLPPVAEVPLTDSLMIASAAGELDAADSIQWVPAVARTWVNVRRDASRIGDVVGVIKPSEKAMLGIGRSGWRQVRAPEVTGWVDPRLFEADSLRTRG